MSMARHIGHVGALAVALALTATFVPVSASTTSPAVKLSADSTALIMCGTTCPTPDASWVETVKNQFIAPTHPGEDIDYVEVTTPEEYWPVTGLLRLIGSAVGDPGLWGPGGPGWPDEPWWKLSGLFDLTIDQSIQAGVADLETAMATYGNDHLVIYGDSQAAAVAILVKRKLAEQYPTGTPAPDIQFVLGGDTNLPNGGLNSRFPGLYIPILDLSFNGSEPTNTQFHTDVITRQYDGAADFPLYPLNVISTLNALLGFVYLHTHPFDVTLAPDASTSVALQGTHGDTSYYFFETQDLPLFAPLRMLGVPEALIDVVEPFFRVIVELGYDRSIPPWEPTPARLIPTLDSAKVATDLVNAVGEGIDNAAAAIGSPPPTTVPVAVTLAAPGTEAAALTAADTSPKAKPTDTPTEAQPTASESVDAVEPEATATPDPAKPARQPAKLRPLVRDSLKADQPTTQTAAAEAEAATSEPSPAPAANTASPSAGSDSKPDDSPGADDTGDE